jgi:hypothetical protein
LCLDFEKGPIHPSPLGPSILTTPLLADHQSPLRPSSHHRCHLVSVSSDTMSCPSPFQYRIASLILTVCVGASPGPPSHCLPSLGCHHAPVRSTSLSLHRYDAPSPTSPCPTGALCHREPPGEVVIAIASPWSPRRLCRGRALRELSLHRVARERALATRSLRASWAGLAVMGPAGRTGMAVLAKP